MEPKDKKNTAKRNTKNTVTTLLVPEQGKLPPQALELEEAVLGALMLEKDALTQTIEILNTQAFYKESHQIIFNAIKSLFGRSEPVDMLTVTNELRNTGSLEEAGGAFYIAQLTARVASAANIEYHARIIMQKFLQRELIRISTDIITDAYEDTTDVFELLDKAERNLFDVTEVNIRRKEHNMAEMINKAIMQVETASKQEGNLSGIASGFFELDKVTAGWQKSDLVIIAARPGMGKTAFVLSMARNMAVEYEKPVAFFSLEMSATQLVTRLISSESEIEQDKLKKGSLTADEWKTLHSRIRQLAEAPIFIDDTPALSIFELRAKCRRMKAQHDIQVVIVDYLQLMSSGVDLKGNRQEEISIISRSLKSLAKELDVPVLCLSQLSRAVETRGGNKRPILSDLRESGAIEQDADLVLFIYRPEYYQVAGDENPDLAQILIAKHRNGALRDIDLRFVDRFAKFENLTENDYRFSGLPGNAYEDDDESHNGNGNRSITLPSKMNKDNTDEPPF